MSTLRQASRATPLAITLLAGLALALAGPARAVEEGEPAPAFSVESGEGATIDFPAHAEGKPAIVLFWATWCPYCHVVMPHLQTISEEFADAGVEVYAVNTRQRENTDDPVLHIEERGFDFIVLPHADAVDEAWDVAGIPGIFVVDGAGQVVYRRKPTDEEAGDAIAQYWADEVRDALTAALATEPLVSAPGQ